MNDPINEVIAGYGDLKGTVFADGTATSPLHSFCESQGVDTEKFFPVSISFAISERHEGQPLETHLSVYAVDKSKIMVSDIDEIVSFSAGNEMVIPVTEIVLKDCSIDQFLLHCKRFGLFMLHSGLDKYGCQLDQCEGKLTINQIFKSSN